jgi:hypothetical protein
LPSPVGTIFVGSPPIVATNNSWGGGGFTQSLKDAMAALEDTPGHPSTLDGRLLERTGPDDKLESAIANYELAFRMQMSIPEVMDLSKESKATMALYGVGEEPTDDSRHAPLLWRCPPSAGSTRRHGCT